MDSAYQTHLQSKLNPREYFLLNLLLQLVQCLRVVKLEQLSQKLPLPIEMESRRRKLQRFFDLSHWAVETIWWPLVFSWIATTFSRDENLYLAIDRTQWCQTNLLVVSLIYRNRAVALHFEALEKLGNSNYEEQTSFLEPVLAQLEDYTVVLLGDREFCGVDLASWLEQRGVYIALRLKKTNISSAATSFRLLWRASIFLPDTSAGFAMSRSPRLRDLARFMWQFGGRGNIVLRSHQRLGTS